jgi:hypothetical protein
MDEPLASTTAAAADADAAAAAQQELGTGATAARKEAQDPGKRREKQRAAAAAARKRREEKGPRPTRDRRREPRAQRADTGEGLPAGLPVLPTTESDGPPAALPALPTVGSAPAPSVLPAAGVVSTPPPPRVTVPADQHEEATSADTEPNAAPSARASSPPDVHAAPESRPGPDRPSATKPIMAPVISSPAEPTTQCATVIEPRLKAAIREAAKQRPADPLRFIADWLITDPDSLPPRDAAHSPPSDSESVPQNAAPKQSVAAYLSAEVLPGVHEALLELIRYQPPVTDDAALAAEIMARALRSGAAGQST